MNDRLEAYVNGVFAPYDGVKSVAELKAELGADLQERYQELKAEGKDDATAFELTIAGVGDIEQTVLELANSSHSLERQVLINFSAGNLPNTDFAGVVAHNGKFHAAALRGSDFSGADLAGSSFKASDLREAKFDLSNLTDCSFYTLDLSDASFKKTTLVRTEFYASGLGGTRFTDVKFMDAKLAASDLRKTVFEKCVFSGVDFKNCDMRGMGLDGLTFVGVRFDGTALDEVSFKGATLRNVSIRPAFSLTNKKARAMKTINFDGAIMDKLTHASLKGLMFDCDLSKVTII